MKVIFTGGALICGGCGYNLWVKALNMPDGKAEIECLNGGCEHFNRFFTVQLPTAEAVEIA